MKALVLILSSFCLLASSFAAPAKRPNILFIVVDDQSPFDFKFYNPKSPLQSPNIDKAWSLIPHGTWAPSAARCVRLHGT